MLIIHKFLFQECSASQARFEGIFKKISKIQRLEESVSQDPFFQGEQGHFPAMFGYYLTPEEVYMVRLMFFTL